MEHACERSYTRSIGVSNFSAVELDEVMAMASTPPVVDQIQLNPFAYREGLARACAPRRRARGVQPLRHGCPPGGYPVVGAVARRLERTPAQVLLRWCVQRGVPVVCKSRHRDRIEENARIFDFALSPQDMDELDALDRTGRTAAALERKWWSG